MRMQFANFRAANFRALMLGFAGAMLLAGLGRRRRGAGHDLGRDDGGL